MFLYNLETAGGKSLYETLTACIRQDILSGTLAAGTRLPSKRQAAALLGVSVVTIMGAYEQLLAEGYIVSKERQGYYVAQLEQKPYVAAHTPAIVQEPPPPAEEGLLDLVHNHVPSDLFPLSLWNHTSRRMYAQVGQAMLRRVPYNGLYTLRRVIADSLYESRGILATPEQILISAGNEMLYNVLLSFFGRDCIFGVEDPGYRSIARLYAENGATVRHLPLDGQGVMPSALEASGTQILHISPAHHFPTGIVTTAARRQELLSWLEADPHHYIIEDDYDSEFRMSGRPIPSLQRLDTTGRVVYINTFTKTLAPSLRIAYAVLSPALLHLYQARFGWLSCPVAVPEQYILAAFMQDGSFARHINRMRTRCRALRDRLLAAISDSPYASRYHVSMADGGLHFLLRLDTTLSDEALCRVIEREGVRILTLGHYYATPPEDTHTLVVNYAGLTEPQVLDFVERLDCAIRQTDADLMRHAPSHDI